MKRSDFAKLRYNGAQSSLVVSHLVANARFSIVCPRDFTNLPCGTGPNNLRFNRFQLSAIQWTRPIGNATLQLGSNVTDGTNVYDDLARRLNGVSDPLGARFGFHDTGVSLGLSRAAGRHQLALSTGLANETSTYNPTAGRYQIEQSVAQQRLRARLEDRVKLNDRDSATLALASYRVTGATPTIQASFDINRRISSNESISIGTSIGRGEDPVRTLQPWTDPAAAAVFANCTAGSISVGAPSDAARPFSYATLTTQYRRAWRGGFVRVSGYRQLQRDDAIGSIYPITAVARNEVPDGYIDALRATWDSPAVCGGKPFRPDQVYVSQNLYGTRRLYQALDVALQVTRRNLIVLGTLSLSQAKLTATRPVLDLPTSFFRRGQQLPGRPFIRANVTLDYAIGNSGLEVLANDQFTGNNNAYYVPSFQIATLGVTGRFRGITITVLDVNAFGVGAERFLTPKIASPLTLVDGRRFLPNPGQISPRQITVVLSTQVGARR